MKRLFVILALVGASFFNSSYAAGTNMSPSVVHAFESSFTGARDIIWEQVGVLSKVTFSLDGHYQSVFYNNDGDLIATTKNISSAQLPKALQTNLKKELDDMWVTEIFVVTVEGDDTYYVKIENADTVILMKAAGSKKWMVYQKDEK